MIGFESLHHSKDFSLVLATIVTSLANFLKISESDIGFEELMGEGEETENNREQGSDAVDLVQENELELPTAPDTRSTLKRAPPAAGKTKRPGKEVSHKADALYD